MDKLHLLEMSETNLTNKRPLNHTNSLDPVIYFPNTPTRPTYIAHNTANTDPDPKTTTPPNKSRAKCTLIKILA